MAERSAVPVSMLASEPVLLPTDDRAPEFNQFVMELCRSVGVVPAVYRGSVESICAAVDLVTRERCVLCVPASGTSRLHGLVWRPLVEPLWRYPWSVLWRAGNRAASTQSVVKCVHQLSQEQGWLLAADLANG